MFKEDMMNQTQVKTRETQTSKFLTFQLGNEQYGFRIDQVIEIVGMQKVTPIPKTPDYIRGVINLRGIIHPVIDLNQKFGMDMTEETKETCIIVVTIDKDGQKEQIGIIVDAVSEVEDISKYNIEPAPDLGNEIDTKFIQGMAKSKGEVKMLLDLQNTLSNQELNMINKVSKTKNENNK